MQTVNLKNDFLVLIGAAVGGALGYVAFFWIARQGFYGLVLPGGALGLVAGIFKPRSEVIPFVCGVSALALGLFAEWRLAPFIADAGFGYFLSHVHQLEPITMILIAAGAVIGFWVPLRRSREEKKA
jgi:hypothetical protein